MAQIGNKQNAKLNGEWGKHVRGWAKRFTAKCRRNESKRIILSESSDSQTTDKA